MPKNLVRVRFTNFEDITSLDSTGPVPNQKGRDSETRELSRKGKTEVNSRSTINWREKTVKYEGEIGVPSRFVFVFLHMVSFSFRQQQKYLTYDKRKT